MENKIVWKYGENEYFKYYDATIDGHYLLVFSCNWSPDIWTASVDNNMIHNKTKNDRQRKRQGLQKNSPIWDLQCDTLLSGPPEYLMKKTEYCYKYNKIEISE